MNNLDFTNKDEMIHAIDTASSYISSKIARVPDLAIVLGSGLGAFATYLQNPLIIDYHEIPFFPCPSVEGHGGKLFAGELNGKYVLVMQGRTHYYEGYDIQTITLPIRIFARMGIKSLILTNACGGINKHFEPAQLMLIEDHLAHFCPSPLRGAHLDELGPRFVDMSQAYDLEYLKIARECADKIGLKVQKGVYAFWPGPTYETAAEIRAYASLGADVVGMSTVAETMVANSCGMRVLGISCITNMTCVISKSVTSHEEVIEKGLAVADDFIRLITAFIKAV